MISVDRIYNVAADYGAAGDIPEGTPAGVVQLARVHRVFNAIMGGGFDFAMECIDRVDFEHAVEGFRYLNLTEIADLLTDLVHTYGQPDSDEQKEQTFDDLVNESRVVLNAYRGKASEFPSDFGL